MKIEVSVIIVNYNGLKYLENCLNSLNNCLKNLAFEIIIIDNNSSDSSCDFIKKNHPECILFESKINLGFGKGNNEAVKQANGDYLLLINNDTILLNEITPILECIKNDQKIGVIGINMLDANKQYLPPSGNFPNVQNMFFMKKLFQTGVEFQSGNFSKTSYEVDWLGGSFLFLTKELYERIGGFSEDYFMYVEDVDFCKKIADIGYKRIFLPNYSYIHFVGFDKTRKPLLIKGFEIYVSKHFTGLEKGIVSTALQINKLVKKIKKCFHLD
jgi:GT2 family glycosyltransferase